MLSLSLPKPLTSRRLSHPHADITSLQWISAPASYYDPTAEVAGLQIKGLSRFLALERQWWFWVAPYFGGDCPEPSGRSKPNEWQFMLATDNAQDEHMLLLPLVAGDWRAYLRPEGEAGITLGIHGGAKQSHADKDAPLLLLAKGKDPIRLVQGAFELLQQKLGTFKLAKDKRTPAWVDYFGWCTWDAFYQDVSEAKVIKGLDSFKRGGVQPKFMILDDGWQDVDAKGRLNKFSANKKFPKGLKRLTDKAKTDYGVELFGVWHAFQGYWGGVNPRGPLAKHYQVKARQGLKPCNMKKQEIGLVAPNDIARFYHDYYAFLAQQGVGMTKVDSQSGMQELCGPGYGGTMQAYQRALQGAAHTHMEGNLLHCMSNSQDVAYNMAGSIAFRNSDDFYPHKPESHTKHLIINAYNAIWSSNFSIPDWDMFKSSHETGEFHGAARAISGGPVYISDGPGEQKFSLIKKLLVSDGTALRCDGAATALSHRVYHNPAEGEGLLLVANTNGDARVVGAFHCLQDGPRINDSFTPVHAGIESGQVLCYRVKGKTCDVIKPTTNIALSLGKLGVELCHLIPVDNGVAVIGLLDKFNCRAAVSYAGWEGKQYRMTLRDGGNVGFYSRKKISKVTNSDGVRIAAKRNKAGYYQLSLPRGTCHTLSVTW